MSATHPSRYPEEDVAREAFSDGSVRDELLRLARTLNGLVEAKTMLHDEVNYLRDRLTPILDLNRPISAEGLRDRPDEGVKPATDLSTEIRRLASVIEEETDGFLAQVREIAWLRERIAL
jgi:hypothetical protein